jgi:hypothetical protein
MDAVDVRRIRARLDEIQGELAAGLVGHTMCSQERAMAEREHVAALQREFAHLQASLPKTGAQAGTLELTHMRLTTGFIPRPEPDPDDDAEIRADPMLRWLVESGQSW